VEGTRGAISFLTRATSFYSRSISRIHRPLSRQNQNVPREGREFGRAGVRESTAAISLGLDALDASALWRWAGGFSGIFSKLAQYDFAGWAVLEWECCIKSSDQGAGRGCSVHREFTSQSCRTAFDDFANWARMRRQTAGCSVCEIPGKSNRIDSWSEGSSNPFAWDLSFHARPRASCGLPPHPRRFCKIVECAFCNFDDVIPMNGAPSAAPWSLLLMRIPTPARPTLRKSYCASFEKIPRKSTWPSPRERKRPARPIQGCSRGRLPDARSAGIQRPSREPF